MHLLCYVTHSSGSGLASIVTSFCSELHGIYKNGDKWRLQIASWKFRSDLATKWIQTNQVLPPNKFRIKNFCRLLFQEHSYELSFNFLNSLKEKFQFFQSLVEARWLACLEVLFPPRKAYSVSLFSVIWKSAQRVSWCRLLKWFGFH